VAALEHELADSKSAVYSKLRNDKVRVILHEVAMKDQTWKFSDNYKLATPDGPLSLNVPLWDAGHVYEGATNEERTAMETGCLIEKATRDTTQRFGPVPWIGQTTAPC
jgi:hypothetical protein